MWVRYLGWEDSREEGMAGYSPWGHKESDTTEQLNNKNQGIIHALHMPQP